MYRELQLENEFEKRAVSGTPPKKNPKFDFSKN